MDFSPEFIDWLEDMSVANAGWLSTGGGPKSFYQREVDGKLTETYKLVSAEGKKKFKQEIKQFKRLKALLDSDIATWI